MTLTHKEACCDLSHALTEFFLAKVMVQWNYQIMVFTSLGRDVC